MNRPKLEELNTSKKKSELYIKKHYPEFYQELYDKYPGCDSLVERLYCFYNGMNEPPKCPVCGGGLKFHTFSKGYQMFCSVKCLAGSDYRKNKSKQTCLEKYGVEHPLQSEEIRNKTKQTCLEKYGVEHALQSDEMKDHFKQTCLERYGVENPSQSEEIKNKKKQTCLEHHGVENPSQSEEIKNKFRQTCLEKYGVEHPLQSQKIQNKLKQTNLDRYGAGCSLQSKEVRNKSKQTCLEKYGVEHPLQSQKIQNKLKQTNLDRYGVANPFQSEEIKNKIKQTCLEKYGVEYPIQSDEIQSKINNTKRSNNTFNTSKIEEEFASYLDQNHIIYKRQCKSDLYPFNCDFYLPDYELYIEIQGSWTHGHHPYNIETDRDKLELWKAKNSDYYRNAIKVWTKKDPLKRETAKLNNLNYLEVFSNNIDEVVKQFKDRIKKEES